MHKHFWSLVQPSVRNRGFIILFICGMIFFSIGGIQNLTSEWGISPNTIVPTSNKIPHSADINDPVITLVNPTQNNSYVQKSLSGFFTFMIDVTANDTEGNEAKMIAGMDPQLEIDNVVYNFTDMSAGDLTSFFCDWPMTGYDDQDLIWAKINATNNNTCTTTIFLNLTVDAVGPSCTVINPNHNGNVSCDTIINMTATDDESGIDYVNLSIHYLKSPFTIFSGIPLQKQGADWWKYQWNVSSQPMFWLPGYYNLSFKVSDKAGNNLLKNVTVLVDCNVPVLDFWKPGNYSAISGIVTFEIFARDYGTGVENVTIQIKNNAPVLMTRQNLYNFTYSYDTQPDVEESIAVIIRAFDYSGLVNISWANFTIDNTLPTISFTGNTNLAGLANFSLECDDANGISTIRWRMDNGAFKTLNIPTPFDIHEYLTFSTLNYPDGNHTLQLLIEDRAGNQQVVTRSLFIDNTPPQISVRNLQDGLIISPDSVIEVWVYETIRDNIIFTYKINTNAWVDFTASRVAGTNCWMIQLGSFPELRSGDNQITLRAYNLAGGYDEDSYYFIINKPPPFDWWILAYLAGAILAIYGIVILTKKFRATSLDYKDRLTKEVKRVKEQKAIEKSVSKDLEKIDLGAPGGLFKKPKKPEAE